METPELIRFLADNVTPVRRLAAPWRRMSLWFALSLIYVVMVMAIYLIAGHGGGPIDARLVLEETAILATAITAAIASFSSTVPGRDRRVCLLPFIPLGIWLFSLGEGCLGDWIASGAGGLKVRADWHCAPTAIILGLIPAALMIAMVRRGTPIEPRLSFGLAALAVGAIVNFGLRIFHSGDISIMVLAWHFGAAALLAVVAGQLGRFVLNWRTALPAAVPLR
jgi:hypothetical protein